MANSDTGWLMLVPGDPGQRTGGYGYVREVAAGLERLGQRVTLQGLPGRFPNVDEVAQQALEDALAAAPDASTVIVDGLALCGCPAAAEAHGARLRLIALVHHPLADETGLSDADRQHFIATERRALAAVDQVITTSETTAAGLDRFDVPPGKITVVTPGVHTVACPEEGPGQGQNRVSLLCLAHLSPRKAQLDLLEALGRVEPRTWTCELAGSMDRDPAYAAQVKERITTLGLQDQVNLLGELSGPALEQVWSRTDLFVLPSRYEGYGMVVDEALAHGLPVVASDGGALAVTAARPGCVTYPAGDTDALANLLEERLQDPGLLRRQRRQACATAAGLRSWDDCAREFYRAVSGREKLVPEGSGFSNDWLRLREPADHAARARKLDALAIDWLHKQPGEPLVVADIGAGSGSNWRYLFREFPEELRSRCAWHLYDQDRALLADVATGDVPVVRYVRRLDAGDLAVHIPDRLHLMTASALIDLMSTNWLNAFAQEAAARNAAVLVVLSYAGRFRLAPTHRYDDRMKSLVNAHQHGDKGTGAACGPEASEVLAAALRSHGYSVCLEPSTWRLGQEHADLQVALMEGWAEAARAQFECSECTGTAPPAWLGGWLLERITQARQGQLAIEVDHADLFGAPPL